jgi:Zinc knuckle
MSEDGERMQIDEDIYGAPASQTAQPTTTENDITRAEVSDSADASRNHPQENPQASAPTDDLVDNDDPDTYKEPERYIFRKIWPATENPFIPAEELPRVVPGEYTVPPFTVRYRLPQGINTNIDRQTAAVRQILMNQVTKQHNTPEGQEFAERLEIAFPKQLGRRDDRFFSVDISARNRDDFQRIRESVFTLKGQRLDILDVGPPVPANLLTVTVSHVPTPCEPLRMGKDFADAICKRYEGVIVHDVFQKFQLVIKGHHSQVVEMPSGTLVASVQFYQARQDQFPDSLIRRCFPGFIDIRGLPYQTYYVGRINHCIRCKAEARWPHTLADCPRPADERRTCYVCRERGHTANECPRASTDETNGDNNTSTSVGGGSVRRSESSASSASSESSAARNRRIYETEMAALRAANNNTTSQPESRAHPNVPNGSKVNSETQQGNTTSPNDSNQMHRTTAPEKTPEVPPETVPQDPPQTSTSVEYERPTLVPAAGTEETNDAPRVDLPTETVQLEIPTASASTPPNEPAQTEHDPSVVPEAEAGPQSVGSTNQATTKRNFSIFESQPKRQRRL